MEPQRLTTSSRAGDASQLKDNVVAVDAAYYLARIVERHPEPLVPALGAPLVTGKHIEDDLDKWHANSATPFFIFDGCAVKGQDEVSLKTGLEANTGTDGAWELYSRGEAENAVSNFGSSSGMDSVHCSQHWPPSNVLLLGAFRPQSLFPLLQNILRRRGLHFLVPPFKAIAQASVVFLPYSHPGMTSNIIQIAYFSKSEIMCGAIMGPRELLLYPIKDPLIQEIDWETHKFTAVSRDVLMNQLGVDESLFVDALLVTGSSFLPPFPARAQPQQPFNTVRDAVNMLRANGKHVKQLCNSFDDILKEQPDWFDKFCKARMIVKHFIYITDKGAVEVENYEALTADSHEYLGIRLPDELLHYLNTGLIGPNIPSWITHSKLTILPTLDGVPSTEYKNLVLERLQPLRELALGLVVPRLNRGLHYKDIEVGTWFAPQKPTTIRTSNFRTPSPKVATWDVEETVVTQHFPAWSLDAAPSGDRPGSLAFEILSLQKPAFAKDTVSKAGAKAKADSPRHVISSVIWRFLHLRDYVNDSHELTGWGKALATAITTLRPTVRQHPDVLGLNDALLLAFELVRLGRLNDKPHQDEAETPLHLLSRCAVLLNLRHEAIGYTGPLRKDMLTYLSQVSAVREADRDLVDAITLHLFLNNKAKREREPSEYWDISNA